jgi:uncharacterized protein involved in outer membrane biogenesis
MILLLILAYLSADKLLERLIENYGSQALGAKVEVNGVFISPYLDQISINRLSITQHTAEHPTLQFGHISASYDVMSLFKPVINIYNVALKNPVAFYTISANTDSLKMLSESSKESDASKTPEKKDQKLFIIDKIIVDNLLVKASISNLVSREMNLKHLEFKDLGKSSNGITAEDVAEVVVNTIIKEVTQSNIKSLLKHLDLNKLKQDIDKIGDATKKSAPDVTSQILGKVLQN